MRPPLLRTIAVLAGALLGAAPAAAYDAHTTMEFEDHGYSYRLDLRGIPACPTLLDTLYSMETMRRLTTLAEEVVTLEEAQDLQVVQVRAGVFGFRIDLVYSRTRAAEDGIIVLELLSQEGNIPLVSLPTTFVAGYRVEHEPGGTHVVYTQDATVKARATLHHQLFVRAQMSLFEHNLSRLIGAACPAPGEERR